MLPVRECILSGRRSWPDGVVRALYINCCSFCVIMVRISAQLQVYLIVYLPTCSEIEDRIQRTVEARVVDVVRERA